MHEISVEVHFSAAHHLRMESGQEDRVHGHNWRAVITVRAEKLDRTGLALDFRRLKILAREVTDTLDHQDVNTVPPFDQLNPTAENIARWIFEETASRLDNPHLAVHRVQVWEEEGFCASYIA